MVKQVQFQWSGFSCAKTRYNRLDLVPTVTQTRSTRFEPLLILRMTVAIDQDLHYALMAPSMKGMTPETQILFAKFVLNWFFTCILDCNQQDDITLSRQHSIQFGVLNSHMICIIFSHTPMNYHISKFGYWFQENAVRYENRCTNFVSWRNTVKNCNLSSYHLSINIPLQFLNLNTISVR